MALDLNPTRRTKRADDASIPVADGHLKLLIPPEMAAETPKK